MSPEAALVMHRAFINEIGEDIIIRRYTGTGTPRPKKEATIRARVVGYSPNELVGSIVQGDRKIIALVDPLASVPEGQFALSTLLPLTTNDKVVVRNKELAILGVDDNTRRIAGALIAIELQARG